MLKKFTMIVQCLTTAGWEEKTVPILVKSEELSKQAHLKCQHLCVYWVLILDVMKFGAEPTGAHLAKVQVVPGPKLLLLYPGNFFFPIRLYFYF